MNEAILAHDLSSQKGAKLDFPNSARYVEAGAARKALSEHLANKVAEFLEQGGKVIPLEGFEYKNLPAHTVSDSSEEFAGYAKTGKVYRWLTEKGPTSGRRKMLIELTGICKSRMYSITLARSEHRCFMTNAEFKLIQDAMPIIERLELEAETETTAKKKGAVV